MADKVTVLYCNGRIGIPKQIRKLANISEGDLFIITVKDNKIILKKARVVEEKSK